jgi:polyphosphate kinase
LLSFPYESFGYIVRFIREAAIDPSVFSIQISLYRLAKESSIAAALINAVHNGKSVTIVVELQARFMEEENLLWARKMQEEGAKVIFGKPGFKVHAKLIVISRRKNFKTTHLVHVGTGNFNESTAKVYGDHSYLTARKRIASEALKVFELIQDFRPSAFKFNQLWVSPVNTQQELIRCIATETRNHISGKPARVVLKCNNLVDPFVLQELQKAIDVGVPVDLIIRGICTLPVSMKQSHVRAISIVDRYLEHARIYAFENNGNPLVYMGSADIMQRNLRHRVEVCVPILDKAIKQTLMDVLEIQMADNQKARLLDKDMKNKWAKKYSGSAPWGHAEMEEKLAQQAPIRSQFFLRDYFEHGS